MSSDEEVSSDEEEQGLFTQPDAVDLTVMVDKEDEQCTTEVTSKHGSSQSKKKHKGTMDGSSQSKKKKQRPEISNADLANQLKKVPALNANDSLLQATQNKSTQASKKLKDQQQESSLAKYSGQPKNILQDVKTRGCSTYCMLKRLRFL